MDYHESQRRQEERSLKKARKKISKVKRLIVAALRKATKLTKFKWEHNHLDLVPKANNGEHGTPYNISIHIEAATTGTTWTRTSTGNIAVIVRAGKPYGAGNITTRYPERQDGTVDLEGIAGRIQHARAYLYSRLEGGTHDRRIKRNKKKAEEARRETERKELRDMLLPEGFKARRTRDGKYTVTIKGLSLSNVSAMAKKTAGRK